MDNKDDSLNKEQPSSGYTYVQGLGFVPYGPAYRERTALITTANAIGLAVLFYLFLRSSLPAYVGGFFRLLFPGIRYVNSHLIAEEWVVQTVNAISFLLCMAAAFGLYMLFIRIPRRAAFPMRRVRLSMLVPAVFIALAVSVMGMLATNAVSRVFRLAGLIPIMPDVTVSATSDGLVFALVNICILPAILEELVYRGVLMQSLRRFGDGFALAVSAVVFSVLHLNLAQAPNALLMGFVIGYFVLRTGSLWAGIVIHFCNNFFALAQQFMFSRVPVEAAETASTVVLLVYLILGVISTVLLSRSTDDLFRLNTVPSPFSMRQKCRMFFTCPAMIITLVLVAAISIQNIQILR